MRARTALAAALVVAGCGGVEDADVEVLGQGGDALSTYARAPALVVSFRPDWSVTVDESAYGVANGLGGRLFAGSAVTVRVDAARFPRCGIGGTVKAFLRLPTGRTTAKTLRRDPADASIAKGDFALAKTTPAGEAQLWLQAVSGACVEWDSRFGENYRFPVQPWVAPGVVRFGESGAPVVEASLRRRGVIAIEYDWRRLPQCNTSGSASWATWHLEADARFDGGPAITGSVRGQRLWLAVPPGAARLELSFRTWHAWGCEARDDNAGRAYRFSLR